MEIKEKAKIKMKVLIFLEITSILLLSLFFLGIGNAQIGNNVSVKTSLLMGNSLPEVVNVTIYQDTGNGIDLVPNSTKEVVIEAIIRDYNGEEDIKNSSVIFYDAFSSFYEDFDDNNYHYSNFSCEIDRSYGDMTEANATCRLEIWYYANNASWNVTVYSYDNSSLSGFRVEQTTINTLLAIEMPDEINYGLINSTNVSDEQTVNVTNYGNVGLNLSMEGYAVNVSDGLAMNCTLGAIKNISIMYEKYNLTSSNTSILNLAEFEGIYTNLTSAPSIKYYGLNQRINDSVNEATNSTYWRIYVPTGVAGSCSGNIMVGATQAAGS